MVALTRVKRIFLLCECRHFGPCISDKSDHMICFVVLLQFCNVLFAWNFFLKTTKSAVTIVNYSQVCERKLCIILCMHFHAPEGSWKKKSFKWLCDYFINFSVFNLWHTIWMAPQKGRYLALCNHSTPKFKIINS